MAELAALIAAVDSLNRNVEETGEELTRLRADIAEKYIPRVEVDERAAGIRRWLAGLLIAGVVVAACAGTGWYVNYRGGERNSQSAEKSLYNCEQTRMGLREVIEIAVADRPVLSSSTPDAIAAIEKLNREQVRPLRERLLALDGTNPELCR